MTRRRVEWAGRAGEEAACATLARVKGWRAMSDRSESGSSGGAGDALARGRALVAAHQEAEALPLLQEALALAPKSAEAWAELGAAYSGMNRYDEGITACDRALNLAPGHQRAWLLKGTALCRLARYEEALDALRNVMYDGPLAADAANWRCQALCQLKRFQALNLEASRMQGKNGQDTRFWWWRAEAAFGARNVAAALAIYTMVHDPQQTKWWQRRAECLFLLRRYDECLATCDQIIAVAPENPLLWHLRGFALFRQHRYNEAVVACDQSLTRLGRSWERIYSRGVALQKAGRIIEALDALTDAAALAPGDVRSLNALGEILGQVHYYERALALFARVRAGDPRMKEGWKNTGECLIQAGRLDEAQAAYTWAAQMESADGVTQPGPYLAIWRGILDTRQGQFVEAAKDFDDALVADSNSDEARAGYAELLLARGDPAGALAEVERAIADQPHIARYWSLKARILRAAADAADAMGADEAEAHAQTMLAEQRAAFAAWEAAHPGWPGAEDATDAPDAGGASGAE